MPASRAKLQKAGLRPRESAQLVRLGTGSPPTRTELMEVGGFTKRQADELVKGEFVAVTNTGGYTLATLIKKAGFTRAQATLILAAT